MLTQIAQCRIQACHFMANLMNALEFVEAAYVENARHRARNHIRATVCTVVKPPLKIKSAVHAYNQFTGNVLQMI